MKRRVVVITGASSGIGGALGSEYARRGASVVLLGRRLDRLTDLAREIDPSGRRALAVQADVTRDGDLERAVARAIDMFGHIDVVLANAGISVAGALEQLTIDDHRRQLETNVFGVLRTVYASLDALKASRGSLALVGSVSGYLAVPGVGAYAMSKYAVRALGETLVHELRPHGISVTHVAPGLVESEIRLNDRNGRPRDGARDPAPAFLVMPRAVAAKQIADAVDARRREIVVTHHGKLATMLARHAPGFVHGAIRASASLVPKFIGDRGKS